MRFVALLFLGVMLAAGLARAQEAGSGWLGVEFAGLTQEEANALGWEAPRGAKVVKQVPGGPAEAAALQAGDVVWSLDGVEIENVKALIEAVAKKAAGTQVRLGIQRAGREKRLAVTLGAMPAQSATAKPMVAEDAPIPMLDTGGHMALIQSIAFTPDGRQIVSASEDKTIRVWDLATGKTVRTIRGEVAPGQAGGIRAMALSPDGKWLAAGGTFTGGNPGDFGAIRLYDFASGKLVALLRGHKNAVSGLAFSPDGRHLLSGSVDFTAILWDVAPGRVLHRLRGHRDAISAVGFTPDGQRAVTASLDHDLRLWRVADGGEAATLQGHNDKVQSLAVALDGTIASGDRSGEIRLWDGNTGAHLRLLARQKTIVGSLSFSPDSKRLLSTCVGIHISCAKLAQYVWDVASGQETVAYRGQDFFVYASAISPDGRWAATGGGNEREIHLWDLASGQRRPGPDGQPLTLGGSGWQVIWAGFTPDGKQIAWGAFHKGATNSYALTLPSGDAPLTAPAPIATNQPILRTTLEHDGWSLSRPYPNSHGLDIKQGDKVVASIGNAPVAYTFTPDGGTIIAGGAGGVLTAYDRAGNKIGDFIGHESNAFGAVPSPDGRYLVSSAEDQTVRLWNLRSRELLVTLFRGSDGEWVMWTPRGYFAASPAGAGLIGWQINHGLESAAEYVTAAQLRKSLNRPDIVAKAIQLASAEEAVKQSAGTNFKLSDLLAKPVPRFRIVSPAANATLAGATAQLELALEETPDPVNLIRIYVNGAQVDARQPEDGPGFKPGPLAFSVPLAKGRNIIRAVAVNGTGETSAEIAVEAQSEGALDKRGTLRILAIGVDKYPGLGKACRELDGKTPKSCDLSAAVADATTFANAMTARLGPRHQSAVSNVLVNGGKREPSRANVVDALDELRGAKPNDTVLLFVSGHGLHEGQDYYFVPTDAQLTDAGLRKSTAVPWAQFQSVLEGANGRRFLFLDTCRSGNRYSQRLTNEAHEQNIVVYAAARWDQDALERSDLGGGLFTYALVEGVTGKAKDKAGEVRAESLRDYVRARVGELAKPLGFEQEPQFVKGRDAENYLLSRGE